MSRLDASTPPYSAKSTKSHSQEKGPPTSFRTGSFRTLTTSLSTGGMTEVPGHRVIAEVDLLPTDQGGLKSPLVEGNRSLILIFDGGPEGEVQLGAVFEQVQGDGSPGSTSTMQVWFWNDIASVHATPGAEFRLAYGRDVGKGLVREVLPTW